MRHRLFERRWLIYSENYLGVLDEHIDLRRIVVEDWLTIPDQDKFKRRAMVILDEWEQLSLNNLEDYYWAGSILPTTIDVRLSLPSLCSGG